MNDDVLSLRQVRKSFAGVTALADFSLNLRAGEITALVGDNGAGKSTLVKIIAGIHPMDGGEMHFNGRPFAPAAPAAARAAGIEVVHQNLALAANRPVYLNLFLGRELTQGWWRRLAHRQMIAESETLLRDMDVRIASAKEIVAHLSGGQRQGVAIARATHWAQRLILLDEPTAALGVAETMKVEQIIAALKKRRMAVLMISHNLDQVFRLADRICVLRRSEQAGVCDKNAVGKNDIVSMITGVS